MAVEDELLPDDVDTAIDPYATLSISTTASDAEIRSAYRKLALKHHPDKSAPDDREAAHKRFQDIAFAYAVLGDPKRRRRYDTTGSTAESALDDEDFDWTDFFRARYTEVTEQKLHDFAKEYKNGAEERRDLLQAYEKHKGRMDKVYEEVMLSSVLDDEDRFQEIISRAIESGEVEEHKAFTQESAKSRQRRLERARKEAEEAEEYAEQLKKDKRRRKRRTSEDDQSDAESSAGEKEGNGQNSARQKSKAGKSSGKGSRSQGNGGLGDLAAMIQKRQQSRASTFLDDLEAKYAPKAGKSRKRGPMDEPPEEAFARTAARKSRKDDKK